MIHLYVIYKNVYYEDIKGTRIDTGRYYVKHYIFNCVRNLLLTCSGWDKSFIKNNVFMNASEANRTCKKLNENI